MLVCAPLRACHYGRGRSLALLVLKNAQLTRQSIIARSYSSDHAHHEARTESIRNIGIIAHVDAVCRISESWQHWSMTAANTGQGKTTTTERMLYHSGRTRHLGSVFL
jgi:elongation factor G